MQNALVVSKLEILDAHGLAFAFFSQQVCRLEDLLDEDRSLPIRRGREEMKILPERAPDRAGDAHVVGKPPEPAGDRGVDEVWESLDARAREYSLVVQKLDAAHLRTNDEPAKATVAHQDVCASAEQEVRALQLPNGLDRERQLIRCTRPIQQIRRPANSERGHRTQRHVELYAVRAERFRKGLFRVGRKRHGIPGHWHGVDTGLEGSGGYRLGRGANIALASGAW